MTLATVEPDVSTSSTSTAPNGIGALRRNPTLPRRARSIPARRRHQGGADTAWTMGTDHRRANSTASTFEGSMPYRIVRASDLGTGTTQVTSGGASTAMASARRSPDARHRRYLRLWTSRTAAPTWAYAESASTPPIVRATAGLSDLSHVGQSPRDGIEQAGHTMGPRYRSGPTRRRPNVPDCHTLALTSRAPTTPDSSPARR